LKTKQLLFPIIAFLIPLLIRCIPEILMGSYLVGFDNMAYYVPTTLLWLRGEVTLGSFIATAPLLYTLTTSLSVLSGSVFTALKILPPLLLGILGLSIYTYARRGLAWSPIKSLFPTLIGTLYFVALRISWDALREELAIIFLFLALTAVAQVIANKASKKHYLALALTLSAVVLSNQVVAVFALGIILFTLINALIRKHNKTALTLITTAIPAVAIFLTTYYLSPSIPEYRLIFGFPTSPDGWLALFGYSSYGEMLSSEAIFLLYCFGFLLPIAVLSVKRFKSFQMQSWVILLVIAAFIPMVSPSNLRLLMLLTYPLAFYATEGLSRLKAVHWKRLRLPIAGVGLAYLVLVTGVVSWGFMTNTPLQPYLYFKAGAYNNYIYSIPSSMLQNSVSINDCQDTANAVAWLKTNMNTTDFLLSHRVFYGWALTRLDKNQIIMYEYDNPAHAAASNRVNVNGSLYLIWWTPGNGWSGLTTVPQVFTEVYQSGNIAIYSYSK
jgi:hypothetical protein